MINNKVISMIGNKEGYAPPDYCLVAEERLLGTFVTH